MPRYALSWCVAALVIGCNARVSSPDRREDSSPSDPASGEGDVTTGEATGSEGEGAASDAGAPNAAAEPNDAGVSSSGSAPRRIGLFAGDGAGSEYVGAVRSAFANDASFVVRTFSSGNGSFDDFDVVIFPGGTASTQWSAIGRGGQSKLRAFVAKGGGYIGVCAGFYMTLPGVATMLAADIYQPWARGEGLVDVTIAANNPVLKTSGTHRLRYVNGPVIFPVADPTLPGYTVLATFSGNIGGGGITPMQGKPAVVATTFGQGRVVAFSPHPELSGLGSLLKDAAVWSSPR